MSETVETYTQDTETAERPFLVRSYSAELTPGDGRTVDLRIVPYGEVAEVSDGGPVYREEWMPSAFDDQLVAGHRLKVLMNFEHHQGIGNVVGKGVALRSAPDGLHGTFRVFENQDGDKTLELVNDGILGGVSLEAYAKKSIRSASGVVQRVKAHLRAVALCRDPAFSGARVLAVRTEPEQIIDEALLPVDISPERVERLRAQGIVLPDRYQAHPAKTDTPASTGTSADGTRQSDATTSSEERDESLSG